MTSTDQTTSHLRKLPLPKRPVAELTVAETSRRRTGVTETSDSDDDCLSNIGYRLQTTCYCGDLFKQYSTYLWSCCTCYIYQRTSRRNTVYKWVDLHPKDVVHHLIPSHNSHKQNAVNGKPCLPFGCTRHRRSTEIVIDSRGELL